MNKTYYSETVSAVLGNVDYKGENLTRTPLYVNFTSSPNFDPATVLTKRQMASDTQFNAIGSRTKNGRHLPVLDVDGGVRINNNHKQSKAILYAAYKGSYEPTSKIRDLLGDNGIDLEVFSEPNLEYSSSSGRTYFRSMRVSALVLRSEEIGIFDAAESTAENHAHLYIQKLFSPLEHMRLISEMAALGIVSSGWQSLTSHEHMGIVRTPWTAKAENQYPS